ncbi:MAG: hypothetical protein F4169_21230 [Gammaproteobacteria bacterium]|nr:hypothetical protein [Gammaproteobacteria bacterium]
MQAMYAILDGVTCQLQLPSPQSQLLPGVQWGSFDELLTPAYWKGQAWQHERLGSYEELRLGRSLIEELAACLLGGYGMPAELGLAAYRRLRDRGLLGAVPTVDALEGALSEPFATRHGVTRRYRFPRQKARYLAGCLQAIQDLAPPRSDRALRDLLMELPGIGPKTASWVVRNHRGSDAVAIIDVHILRAGRHIGLFPASWQPRQHYVQLESAFLKFAVALDVRASLLDAMIWDYMRRLPPMSAPHKHAVSSAAA